MAHVGVVLCSNTHAHPQQWRVQACVKGTVCVCARVCVCVWVWVGVHAYRWLKASQ